MNLIWTSPPTSLPTFLSSVHDLHDLHLPEARATSVSSHSSSHLFSHNRKRNRVSTRNGHNSMNRRRGHPPQVQVFSPFVLSLSSFFLTTPHFNALPLSFLTSILHTFGQEPIHEHTFRAGLSYTPSTTHITTSPPTDNTSTMSFITPDKKATTPTAIDSGYDSNVSTSSSTPSLTPADTTSRPTPAITQATSVQSSTSTRTPSTPSVAYTTPARTAMRVTLKSPPLRRPRPIPRQPRTSRPHQRSSKSRNPLPPHQSPPRASPSHSATRHHSASSSPPARPSASTQPASTCSTSKSR